MGEVGWGFRGEEKRIDSCLTVKQYDASVIGKSNN